MKIKAAALFVLLAGCAGTCRGGNCTFEIGGAALVPLVTVEATGATR